MLALVRVRVFIVSISPIHVSFFLCLFLFSYIDLIRLIQPDLDNFDPRIWIIAVSVVLGTLVILAIGLCIVLSKECYQSSQSGIDHNTDNTNTITSNTNYTNNTNNTTTTTATSATLATRNNADVERNLNVVVMA